MIAARLRGGIAPQAMVGNSHAHLPDIGAATHNAGQATRRRQHTGPCVGPLRPVATPRAHTHTQTQHAASTQTATQCAHTQ